MNQTVYSYSILKYVHSQIIGEELNIGILFVFPEQRTASFIFPDSLARLKKTYPNFNTEVIHKYLTSFKFEAERKAVKYIQLYLHGYDELVNEKFIQPDSSALRFTPFSNSVAPYDSDTLVNYYYELYFKYYAHEQALLKVTDSGLAHLCRRILKSINPEIEKRVRPDKNYVIERDNIHFRPDLKWKNGSVNLVKGVSFDLSSDDHITSKALLLKSKLSRLQKDINKDVRIDFIISEPQEKKLIPAYNSAYKIVKEIQDVVPTLIYDKTEIADYANKIAKEIHIEESPDNMAVL